MIKTILITLDIATAAEIVQHFRPNAFQGTNGSALATDIALTAAAAVTVAPFALVGKVLGIIR